MCGEMAVIHTANPAIHDIRLRDQAQIFPKLIPPILKDIPEIRRRGLPSQIKWQAFFGWTANLTPGFHVFWKVPSEFQGTLYACPDVVADGRFSEDEIPQSLGQDIVKAALALHPFELVFTDCGTLPQLSHRMIPKEVQKLSQRFYNKRRSDVLEHITELRDMIKKSTDHELLALKQAAPRSSDPGWH